MFSLKVQISMLNSIRFFLGLFNLSLGMPPESFGTHSIRKGAVTYVATGSTSFPPIASICLLANWAMPGVMNHYIMFENAGDQFVG